MGPKPGSPNSQVDTPWARLELLRMGWVRVQLILWSPVCICESCDSLRIDWEFDMGILESSTLADGDGNAFSLIAFDVAYDVFGCMDMSFGCFV